MNALLAPFARLAAAVSARQQDGSALWDPSLWAASVNGDGRLVLDDVDLFSLVARFGSPLMAVSRSKLIQDATAFLADAKAALPDSMVAFSYKTNSIPGVLQELHAAGLAAEVISPYELWLARRLGVPGDRIVVNGVNKAYEFIHEAVQAGVASVNIDDPSEIDHLRKAATALGCKVRVSLRLKVDPDSHFGLAIGSGDAERVAGEIAAAPELFEFAGLHFHVVSDNDDPRRHVRYMTTALDFAKRIGDSLQLATPNLNIGGGYTVPTMKVMSRFEYARQRLLGVPARPPQPEGAAGFKAYARHIAHALHTYCEANGLAPPRIVFEPGRIVASQSHVMLTEVHAIKPNARGPDFAMTDAGKILTSYPCDYEYHQMFVANRMREPVNASYHLMGRLCTTADWLARYRRLPTLRRGDVVAIMDAGAYFTSYSSNFAFPRPEVVMLDRGSAHTLRRRETHEHLVAMDDLAQVPAPG